MKVAVVADLDKSVGFRLAGITETYYRPDAVRELMGRLDVAIVFVQQALADQLDPRTRKQMQDSVQPAFVQLEGEDADMRALIKQALGFEMKS
ncbi:MAG TPA: hypothetical protein ENN60_01935 [archaeon]|nr:hypothetical protein [archaeon]